MALPSTSGPGPSPTRAQRAARLAAQPYNRARHLDRILEQRQVRSIYQPIVDLSTGETIAFEALARGPAGTPMERPDLLFGTARDLGLVQELDWICRATAMDTAMQAGFGTALTLFINVEPDVAATRAPEDLYFTFKRAQQDLRIVLEVTERALLERPAELLHWLSYARKRWWGVALDDVGATSESLALLPFVRPDVVKLNAHLVRNVHDDEDKRVLEAVHEYAQRTGALVLSEGIEEPEDAERATHELGAQLGQGWLFGRPRDLPAKLPRPRRVVPLLAPPPTTTAESPWSIVSAVSQEQTLPEAAVRRRFAQVEQAAMFSREAPVVLASFPPGEGPWGTPEDRLSRLRAQACFCGAVGLDLTSSTDRGWQTSPLPHGEEMNNEWVLLSIAPHQAAVVVAFDADEVDGSGHRLLEVCWSQERDVVSAVAEFLMRRLSSPVVDLDGRLVI